MDQFALFVCGLIVSLIAAFGIITSQVFLGYRKFLIETRKRAIRKYKEELEKEEEDDIIESIV